jgi:hypothetical protein
MRDTLDVSDHPIRASLATGDVRTLAVRPGTGRAGVG